MKKLLRESKGVDWLEWSMFLSVALIALFFITNQVLSFNEERAAMDMQQKETDLALQFKYNIKNSDSTPEQAYQELRQALLDEDLDKAMNVIHPAYRYKYEDGLIEAYEEGRLSEAVERLTPLKEKIYDDGFVTVVYSVEPIPGNNYSNNPMEGYNESVEFTRTQSGDWKISSI
ncbi:MAG: hypothetical protein R3346_03900 [Candidatus Spechtbacterales bacterium]|nr:hypothetical protein [Candidatus Spechtbacterales bacterium]